MSKKIQTFCTQNYHWEDIQDPKQKKVYKQLSQIKDKKNNYIQHRMDHKSIAQLVHYSTYATTPAIAVAVAFSIIITTLTKAEKKIAKVCFELGQGQLTFLTVSALLNRPEMSNNLKTLSQIQRLINENDDKANTVAASLNISLTNKKTKNPEKIKEETKKEITSDVASPSEPLRLVGTN